MSELKRMLNTAEAAASIPGMTEHTLRMGYKQGIFPALQLGHGRGAKLLWDLDMLQAAIQQQMLDVQEQRRAYCEGR